VSIPLARRSFALLIAAHRVCAPGKKTLRKREFPVRATELERCAVPQAEMQVKTTHQIRVIRTGQLEALIIDLAAQRGGGKLHVAQYVVAPGREKGIIATIVPEIEHNRAHSRSLDTGGRRGLIVERGEKLIVVTHADIRVDGPKKPSRAEAAAIFLTDKGDFLAPQSGRVKKHIHVFAEHFRHRVEKVGAAGLERLNRPQPRLVRQAERVFLVEFKTAAQQFVTAVTEQQTEIERLALLDLIDHAPRLVVHRFVANADRIESAEPCQPIPAMLHLDTIQVVARFKLDPAFEYELSGPFVAFKSDFAQSDFPPRL